MSCLSVFDHVVLALKGLSVLVLAKNEHIHGLFSLKMKESLKGYRIVSHFLFS